MRDDERKLPAESSGPSVLALVLVPLGLVFVFAGLCIGLWLLQVAYTALYSPEQLPLVGKVLVLLENDDAILEQVKTETGVRWEGAAVRYGVLMLLLIVVLLSIGSVIRAFIGAGSALIKAALGDKPSDSTEKRQP